MRSVDIIMSLVSDPITTPGDQLSFVIRIRNCTSALYTPRDWNRQLAGNPGSHVEQLERVTSNIIYFIIYAQLMKRHLS